MRTGGIGLAVAALLTLGAAFQGKTTPPKTVKEIMTTTHKGRDNLASEVRNGFGSPEDAKKLQEVYRTLASLKPPQGDERSWKAKTGAVISALQDLIDKKPGAVDRVHSVTECRNCHDVHRPGGNK
jgi:hypothetical protein